MVSRLHSSGSAERSRLDVNPDTGRGAWQGCTVSEVLVQSDITLTSSGTDVNLLLALTTATYNNLQRHLGWYVWSPTHMHAPDPVAGPTTLRLCGVQVAPCPVNILFHCRCSIKVLAGALLDSDPGTVKCLTGCRDLASDLTARVCRGTTMGLPLQHI